jgi:hypothetical protein
MLRVCIFFFDKIYEKKKKNFFHQKKKVSLQQNNSEDLDVSSKLKFQILTKSHPFNEIKNIDIDEFVCLVMTFIIYYIY